MNDSNFNFEIQRLLTHFLAAFDDVQIHRYNGDKYEKNTIKVPFTMAPKSHILQDLVGQTDTVRLPIVAANVTGHKLDIARNKNKIEDLNYRQPDGSYVTIRPIPWNITVELSILAKYQEDVDQIIQNFAVNTNDYIIISWREPRSGRELRTEIKWTGDVAIELPAIANQTADKFPYRIEAKTSFEIKGFLFKTDIEQAKPICYIDLDIIPTTNFYCNYDSLVRNTSAGVIDHYDIDGVPSLKYVKPAYAKVGYESQIVLQGTGLGNTEAIYVSGSNPDMYPLTFKQPLTSQAGFYGYLVEEFNQISPTEVSFTLPAPSGFGLMDILLVNGCGIGKLTRDANRCNRVENPYPPHMPEHDIWCVLQFPYLNGIMVSNNFVTNDICDTCDIIGSSNAEDSNETLSSSTTGTNCFQTTIRTIPHRHSCQDFDNLDTCVSAVVVDVINNMNFDSLSALYNTVNENSGLWAGGGEATTLVFDTSANWNNTTNIVTANSANWQRTYVTVNTNSACWNLGCTVFTFVQSNSSNWTYQGNDVKVLTANWQNTFSTVSSYSALWASDSDITDIANFVQANSANIVVVNNVVFANSACWNRGCLVYNTVSSNSANWNNAFNTVRTNSATTWNYQGTDIKALTANWQNAYNTVLANSSINWNYQGNDVKALTANWQNTYNTTNTNSGNWNSVYATVLGFSALWNIDLDNPQVNSFVQSNSANILVVNNTVFANSACWNQGCQIYTFVQANSSNWTYQGNDVKALTANWQSTYSTVLGFSALWNIDLDNPEVNSFVQANSANILVVNNTVFANSACWNQGCLVYSFVQANSANWNYQGNDIKALTANWQSTYTTVLNNSSIWDDQGDFSEIATFVQNQSANILSNYTTVNVNSGDWESVYSTVNANSGTWTGGGPGPGSGTGGDINVNNFVYANSANILQVNTFVNFNSANILDVISTVDAGEENWNYIIPLSTLVNQNSACWDLGCIVYSFVQANSANWNYQGNDIKALTANWQNTFNTVLNNSANWNYQGNDIKALTANWQQTFTSFSVQSANNLSVYSNVNTNSANWNIAYNQSNVFALQSANNASVYSQVNLLSANWSSVYSNVNSNSANWNQTFVTFSSQSANNLSVYSHVNLTSANWSSVYSQVNLLSANWNIAYAQSNILAGLSANNLSVYSTVNTNSANWNIGYNQSNILAGQSANNLSVYSQVNTLSTNWSSVFTTTNTNSANWNIAYNQSNILAGFSANNASVYSQVNLLSANWSSVYSNVNSNSALYFATYTLFSAQSASNISVYAQVNLLSANWSSVYSNVNGLSANWNYSYILSNQLASQSANNLSVYSQVNTFSGNWNSVYSQVLANSAVWTLSGGSSSGETIIYREAGDFIPRSTSGCGIDSTELSGNMINMDWLTFDPGLKEYAQVWFNWPSDWSMAKVTFYWQASTTGTVVWGAAMRTYNDGDPLDVTLGTPQEVSDAVGTGQTMRVSSSTASITPSGTIASGNRTIVEIYRDPSNGTDDLAVDAYLNSIRIEKSV